MGKTNIGAKKKSLVGELYYYQCLICGKKSNDCKQIEYIDRGGLDDIPSIEYRNACVFCGYSVLYVDDYKKKLHMDMDKQLPTKRRKG